MPKLFSYFLSAADAAPIADMKAVNRLYRKYRISVMLAITLGGGFSYPCRLGLSIVKKPLLDSQLFSESELGLIGAAIFSSYAAGKLVNGVLADYADIRKFFATGVFVSALINLLMGWSSLLWVWMVLWGLNGWFQGFNAPSGVVTLSNWFSNNERGRYYGIWSMALGIGEGLTFIGIAALVSLFNWHSGFWVPGILGLLTAAGLFLFLKDRPQTLGLPSIADWRNDHGVRQSESIPDSKKTIRAQLAILKLPTIWIIGLASAMIYMTRYAINSWGVLYLQEAKGYSLSAAGAIIGINTFAGILGSVAFGFISDHFFKARRPPVNLLYAFLEVVALLLIFYYPGANTNLLLVAFFIYGFTMSGLVVSLGGLFAVDIAPKKAAGAVMGFIGIFSYVAAAIQEWLSGLLLEHGKTIIAGTKHYDFSVAILFWIGSSLLSLLLALMLWRVKATD